jgi:hypothetical protein
MVPSKQAIEQEDCSEETAAGQHNGSAAGD